MIEGINDKQPAANAAAGNAGRQVAQHLAAAIGVGLDQFMGPVLGRVPANYMGPVLGRVTRSGYDSGREFAMGMSGAFDAFMGPVLGRIPRRFVTDLPQGMWAAAHGLGADIIAGLGAGIDAASPQAQYKARVFVGQVIHNMQIAAAAQSPSRLTMALGEDLALGMLTGIENKQIEVMRAAGVFAAAVGGAMGAGAYANYQALGQQMAALYGWGTGSEWTALNNVVMRESGWNPTAQNPTSSAYGIAQNIGGRAGYPDPSPAGQIQWLLTYIAKAYGDPLRAWSHELRYGWYDRGGVLPPGLTLALNTSGRNEYVVGGAGGPAGTTIVLQVDGRTLGNVVLTELLREQKNRPLGIRAS
jgi:hypothetical protein